MCCLGLRVYAPVQEDHMICERIRAMLPTIDAYTPREIAHKIETLGVTKARSDTMSLLVLAVLAGAFIALGALFFTVVVTRSALGFGISRLVGGRGPGARSALQRPGVSGRLAGHGGT